MRVGVSHDSVPVSHTAMLSMGHSTICYKSLEGVGEFNLRNEAVRMTGRGDNKVGI